jgi:hypothetical protein
LSPLYLYVMSASPIASPKILKLKVISVHVLLVGKPDGHSTVIRPMSVESSSTDVMGQEGMIEGSLDGLEDSSNEIGTSDGIIDGFDVGSSLGSEKGSSDG